MGKGRELAGAARVQIERKLGECVGFAVRRASRPSGDPPKTLFVIAHARSGSTMLTHILGAHPDILSVGEHHVSYDASSDLQRLHDRTAFISRDFRSSPSYVVDKIVHTKHLISPALLKDQQTRFVFLLRTPEGTLPSVGKMFGNVGLDRQLNYYQGRLGDMTEMAAAINDVNRMAFTTYEQLTTKPAETLRYLSEFLDLDSPLRQDYGVSRTTGRQAWGDPSERIFSGTIDLNRQESAALPDEVAAIAGNAHSSATLELSRYAAPDPTKDTA